MSQPPFDWFVIINAEITLPSFPIEKAAWNGFLLTLCCNTRPNPNLASLESSRGRGLAAPSHTTGHAGPHPAVHQAKRSS